MFLIRILADRSIWQALVLFILAGLTVHAITKERYDLITLLFVVSVGIFVIQTRSAFLIILIFVAFFGNSFTQSGLLPAQANWLPEALIMGLFARMLGERISTGKQIRFFGGPIVITFVLIAAVSLLLNNANTVNSLLFLRLIFRFYLLLIVLINLDYDETFMLKINKLIAWLFIIQIPTAVVKFFIFGQGERAIGTYAMYGGGPSTFLPLIAIGFLSSYYFLYRKSLTNLWLALGFIVFSTIGGKRAFVFFLPVVIFFIGASLRKRIKGFFRYSLLVVIGLLLTFYFVARLVPTLNPERQVWGTFSPIHIINYSTEYTTHESEDHKAAGRVSATIAIYRYLTSQGIHTTLLGVGPGAFMKSMFSSFDSSYHKQDDKIGVEYGMTGLNWLALQVGYLGATVWLSFYIYAMWITFNYYRRETNTYWRAFQFGMSAFSFVVLLNSLAYNGGLINGDTFPLVYMVLLSFSIKRNALKGIE
jgi:hypothetical protein